MSPTGTEHNVYGRELSDEDVARGLHREMAGGLWEEMGRLQLDFLVKDGLRRDERLLDVGCGCLRAGVHLVRYLDPGGYYGLDVNASLMRAGYDVELAAAGLQQRLRREHLLVAGDFDASRFAVEFDVALAQSLFTHLAAGEVRRCLAAVARSVRSGGRFYATFFEAPAGAATPRIEHAPGGVVSFAERDPFHYRLAELVAFADPTVWAPAYVGEWGHPRAQRMLRFDRL